LALDEVGAKVAFGFVSIVRSAAQRNVTGTMIAALGPGHYVRELQAASLATAPPIVADESAAPLIALPDLALDVRGNAGTGCRVLGVRAGDGIGPRCARPLAQCGSVLCGFGEQGGEGALDDLGGIAVGDLVRQQVLQLSELVVGRLVQCDL